MFSRRPSAPSSSPPQLHVVVHDCLPGLSRGTIACCVVSSVHRDEETTVEWTLLPPGVGEEDIDLDATRLCARSAPAGRYELRVRTGPSSEARISATVCSLPVPRVVGYDVVHASSSLVRDGSVVAKVEDAPPGCSYLWSPSRALTEEPVLKGACVGPVSVSIVGSPFLHCCEVAEVRTRGGE